jgi:hypothetical protein
VHRATALALLKIVLVARTSALQSGSLLRKTSRVLEFPEVAARHELRSGEHVRRPVRSGTQSIWSTPAPSGSNEIPSSNIPVINRIVRRTLVDGFELHGTRWYRSRTAVVLIALLIAGALGTIIGLTIRGLATNDAVELSTIATADAIHD